MAFKRSSAARSERRGARYFLFIAIPLLLVVAFVFFVVRQAPGPVPAVLPLNTEAEIRSAWDSKNYEQVIGIADQRLLGDPLDPDFLFLRGIARYYLAQERVNFDQQSIDFNQSLVDLRRALIVSPSQLHSRIHYVLGKLYFHKGYYYFDLALQHLTTAEDMGFHMPDSFEYLGLVNGELGNVEKGIEFLNASHRENGRAIILLAIARRYASVENFELTLEFTRKAFESSSDSFEKEQALLLAGEAYRTLEDWQAAEQVYRDLFELNPNSADAKFFLGEISAARGDQVQARVYWREAYAINPRHPGAISRLNS